MVHTDLKFFTNEPERDLYSRFAAILKSNTYNYSISFQWLKNYKEAVHHLVLCRII